MGVFESMCLHISRMPLSVKESVELVHTLCYPLDGGLGLWMLEVYLYATHASSFWRYPHHPTGLGLCSVTHCVIGWHIKAWFIPCLGCRCYNSRPALH